MTESKSEVVQIMKIGKIAERAFRRNEQRHRKLFGFSKIIFAEDGSLITVP